MPLDNQSRSSRAVASDCGHRRRLEGAFRERVGRVAIGGTKQPRPPPHRVVGLAQQSCQSRRSSRPPEIIHLTEQRQLSRRARSNCMLDDLAVDRPNEMPIGTSFKENSRAP